VIVALSGTEIILPIFVLSSLLALAFATANCFHLEMPANLEKYPDRFSFDGMGIGNSEGISGRNNPAEDPTAATCIMRNLVRTRFPRRAVFFGLNNTLSHSVRVVVVSTMILLKKMSILLK